MVIKNLAKTLKKGAIAGGILSLVSFALQIVPCRTYLNDTSSLGLCTIQSPLIDITDASTKFYGFSNNPLTPLIVQFIIGFIITMLVLAFIKKRKSSRILDLTRK